MESASAMHAVDAKFFAWDKSVDSDPASRNFSYSIGGRSMYVIGMHPQASRLARTRPYPTMVFNLHQQFERLRARGKFDAMKQTIRSREMSFQGSINPMLTSFGEHSEARQYSGRAKYCGSSTHSASRCRTSFRLMRRIMIAAFHRVVRWITRAVFI